MRVRGAGATFGEDDLAWFAAGDDAAFGIVARGISQGLSAKRAADLTLTTARELFEGRASARLDELAEVWWLGEHGEDGPNGRRARRPYASLPIADRAELRENVKHLLVSRTPESLGDVAVLEAELGSLLDLPTRALARASAAVYRKSENDARWRGQLASAAAVMLAGGQIGIAHVGDCRVSCIRHGAIEALTREHTLRNALGPDAPDGGITRAIGMSDAIDVDRIVLPVERGDVVLLLTKASWESYPSMELLAAVRARGTDAAAYLVERARRSGKSVALVAIEIVT